MKSTFFNHRFLESLPADIDDALVLLADECTKMYRQCEGPDFNDDFLEVYAILSAFFESREFEIQLPQPSPPNLDRSSLVNVLNAHKGSAVQRITARESKSHLEKKHDEYRALFSKQPVYEFSDEDFTRIQLLIDELRIEIQSSTLIPENHKKRLLRRLEALQSELHKKTSEIDRFWGFVGEAGIVSRKFGEDLKPISDRVNELGRIVIAVVMAKEGIKALPDIVKLLQ